MAGETGGYKESYRGCLGKLSRVGAVGDRGGDGMVGRREGGLVSLTRRWPTFSPSSSAGAVGLIRLTEVAFSADGPS